MGTRAEVKNVNKIKHVQKSIGTITCTPRLASCTDIYVFLHCTEYEIERQSALLKAGERVVQETRFFDSRTGTTVRMRTKEDEMDYRYMPEPDLPPLRLSSERVSSILSALPELPDAMRSRYVSAYQLSLYDAGNIVSEDGASAYFEAVVRILIATVLCD